VYHMYSWDRPPGHADERAESRPAPPEAEPTGRADRAEDTEPAARAVQVALDRRDNGGDAGPGQHR
jgi:hypothetical protein